MPLLPLYTSQAEATAQMFYLELGSADMNGVVSSTHVLGLPC